jgi:hypothetical protein
MLDRGRFGHIYDRYRTATMVSRKTYIDNLEVASRLLKSCVPITAAIVECGTWRGGMSAGLIEIFGHQRTYHFFDSFEGLPAAQQIDGASAINWQQDVASPRYFNNCTASEHEFRQTIGKTGVLVSQIHIHRGLFDTTVPVTDTGPIALLRLDGDWYASTMCCLEALFPKVAPGGIVIIDDYGTWDGCTRAVHDYLSAQSRPEAIQRFGASAVAFINVH